MNTLSTSLKNRRPFLDLTTDLQRVVFCVINNNRTSAFSFFSHAQKIYTEKIKDSAYKEAIFDRDLDIIWKKVCDTGLPEDKKSLYRCADKLLTVSSIIFNRTQFLI